MASKLGLYNDALVEHLGKSKLASLTEENAAREYLDDIYNDALLNCLQSGFWNFAMRGVRIDAVDSYTPAFGYRYAFAKPSDWVRTRNISLSETFYPPLLEFQDQTGYWLANSTPLYVRFVSSEMGMSPVNFPPKYADYVAAFLASKVYRKVTGNGLDELLEFTRKVVGVLKSDAEAVDAMDGPTEFPPPGSWVMSRTSRTSRDRVGGRLIG